jgi:hypothetical protein
MKVCHAGRAAAKLYQATDAAAVPPAPNKGMRKRQELVYDEAKEISRTYRRSVYDFDYWANHRSTARYLFHIMSMPGSRIIRSLGAPLAWCARLPPTITTIVSCEVVLLSPDSVSAPMRLRLVRPLPGHHHRHHHWLRGCATQS